MHSSWNLLTNPKQKIKVIKKNWGCKNEKTINYRNDKFCPNCGKKHEYYENGETNYLSFYEIVDDNDNDYEDDFIKPFSETNDNEKIILFSNLVENEIEYDCMEITPEIIKEDKKEFLEHHKGFISYIKNKVESIEIKFGVAQYSH